MLMWTFYVLKVFGKLWATSSSYLFVVVLPSKHLFLGDASEKYSTQDGNDDENG